MGEVITADSVVRYKMRCGRCGGQQSALAQLPSTHALHSTFVCAYCLKQVLAKLETEAGRK